MSSLVEVRLGVHDAPSWLVDEAQAELAVDLCLVARVRISENGQYVAKRGDDGCDLLAGHGRPWCRWAHPGYMPSPLGGGPGATSSIRRSASLASGFRLMMART